MEIYDLNVTRRNDVGKGVARAIRRQGLIPAVLYGPKREPMPLTLSPFDLDKIYKTSGSDKVVLNVIIKNGDTKNVTAMVRETQVVPVSQKYLHIDLMEISLDEEIVVSVVVKVTGKSIGVERGGLLQVVRHELEIACLPTDMPEFIEVDITDLDIGDSLHISDVDVTSKTKLLADPHLTVVTVVAPTVVAEEIPEEEVEEAEKAEAGGAETPETSE